MANVSKAEFKSTYFRHGSTAPGWTRDYWAQSFEPLNDGTWSIDYPETRAHTRMFIMDNSATSEIRMFFLTEESEDSRFRQASINED
jgi:hypothetical protein